MKNKLLVCGAACIVLLCTPVKAQVADTATKNTYEREALMLNGNTNKYCKNKEWKRLKLFGQGLDKEFVNASLESKEELKRYRKHRRRAVVLLAAGGTVMVASLVVLPVVAGPVFFSAFVAGTGAYSVGGYSSFKSRRHLNQSIWLRNRDVIAKN